MIRAGRWTTGISLTFIGVAILLSKLMDLNGYEWIVNLWPFVLIGYGVEYLLVSRMKERVRFDLSGAIIVAIALAIVMGYSFFGVSNIIGDPFTFEESQSIVVNESITSLYAETRNGKIQVKPVLEDNITVIATYRIAALDEDQAKQIKEKYKLATKVTNGQYRVVVEHPMRNWTNVGVDFTIFVPRSIAIDVKTSNGSIDIEGIDEIIMARTSNGPIIVRDSKGKQTILDTSNGRVEVHQFIGNMEIDTSNARVEVRSFTGDLDIDTSNGGVEIDRFSGGLHVDTNNAKIVVTNGTPTGDWVLDTSNGAIEVLLTETGSYKYSFSTTNGKVNAANPPFVNENNSKNRVKGMINGGNIELDFSTTNSNITVNVR